MAETQKSTAEVEKPAAEIEKPTAEIVPAEKKLIVVLGGSYGGVSSAHYLLKHAIPVLPEKDSYQVVLVSPSELVFCRPACPRACIDDALLDQKKLWVSIAKQFEQYPAGAFRHVHGKATHLDHAARTVTVTPTNKGEGDVAATETLPYYALIIATGASTESPLLSMLNDDVSLRDSWAKFRAALPAAKTIIVAGGGPAGVETAGELGHYLNGRAGLFQSRIANPKAKITIVTAADKLLPFLPPNVASKAERYLAKVGVDVLKNARVTAVSPEGAGAQGEHLVSKTTVTLEDGRTLEADIYIPAMGMRPNSAFIDASLLAADGRVETNAVTLRVDGAGERVYAIGDVSSVARPAVHLIFEAVPVLGANAKRDLLLAAGREAAKVHAEKAYKEDTSTTQLVPIGRSKGVGMGKNHRLPSFMVWAVKGRDYWLWTVGRLWSGKQWAKEA